MFFSKLSQWELNSFLPLHREIQWSNWGPFDSSCGISKPDKNLMKLFRKPRSTLLYFQFDITNLRSRRHLVLWFLNSSNHCKMLIAAPVLTCKPLCILSSRKPPKCRVRALLCRDSLFDEQHKLPDACPDHNLSIFFRFKNSLYTSITHVFPQDKGSELMWTYLIYFWAMIRTGKFEVVLQTATCLSNIKGPGRLIPLLCIYGN